VAGITANPLSQLFNEHMTKMLKEFKDAHQGTVTDKVLHDLAQNFSFPVPCLPGDMSLIEDFLADMDMQLRKKPRLAQHPSPPPNSSCRAGSFSPRHCAKLP
jgi:hypothetical protein